MTGKPFAWRKLTPAQINLLDGLATAGGALPYGRLEHRDLVALDELRRLKLAVMQVKGRTKLQAVLTEAGYALRADNYRTQQVVMRVPHPQIAMLRHLDDGPPRDSVGQPLGALAGSMLDVCRRMVLRGWAEWYEGWNGLTWARLTPAGREVLAAVAELDGTGRGPAAADAPVVRSDG